MTMIRITKLDTERLLTDVRYCSLALHKNKSSVVLNFAELNNRAYQRERERERKRDVLVSTLRNMNAMKAYGGVGV